jgi:hypothetical protein
MKRISAYVLGTVVVFVLAMGAGATGPMDDYHFVA